MNNHFRNLEKIEFVVTYACRGKCKHCSGGDHPTHGEKIIPEMAVAVVKELTALFNIKTVLAFGGEPLLYPDAVYPIIEAAREMNVPKRQIITSGYFTKDIGKIRDVAMKLSDCGTNDLLLSVDAFHQETIPLDIVKVFAEEAKRYSIPTRLSPAWLVSRDDTNKFNEITRSIISDLSYLGIPEGDGNVIFPEGNAKKYLSDYFVTEKPANPYVEDPYDIRCISVDPTGHTLGENIKAKSIIEIIESYDPKIAKHF